MTQSLPICTIRVLASLLMLAAVGCGHPTQRKLQGRWIGESIDNVPQEMLAAATGWVKGTSFEFAGDQLTVTIPAEEARTGTYTISSVHDGRILLQAKRFDGTVDPVELRLHDEHSLQWSLPSGVAVRFRKSN